MQPSLSHSINKNNPNHNQSELKCKLTKLDCFHSQALQQLQVATANAIHASEKFNYNSASSGDVSHLISAIYKFLGWHFALSVAVENLEIAHAWNWNKNKSARLTAPRAVWKLFLGREMRPRARLSPCCTLPWFSLSNGKCLVLLDIHVALVSRLASP